MPSSDRTKKINELKRLLAECDDFIKNGKAEWEKDLRDAQREYKKACADLEKFELDCQKEVQAAIAQGYNDSQMKTMKMFHDELRNDHKAEIALAEDSIKHAQEYLDKYPELLAGAQADRKKIEAQLKSLGGNTSNDFWPKMIVCIIMLLALKACCS